MRIIFLDIDGVLNGHERFGNGYCGIRRENVDNLNLILEAVPAARLVISSSWRYMIQPKSMTLEGFTNLLLSHGVDLLIKKASQGDMLREPTYESKLVGHTLGDEDVGGCNGRGQQIMHWLVTNSFNPRFDRHVVLDDMMWDFEKHPELNIILTDPGRGLQRQQVEIAITKLNRPIGY